MMTIKKIILLECETSYYLKNFNPLSCIFKPNNMSLKRLAN